MFQSLCYSCRITWTQINKLQWIFFYCYPCNICSAYIILSLTWNAFLYTTLAFPLKPLSLSLWPCTHCSFKLHFPHTMNSGHCCTSAFFQCMPICALKRYTKGSYVWLRILLFAVTDPAYEPTGIHYQCAQVHCKHNQGKACHCSPLYIDYVHTGLNEVFCCHFPS